MNPNGRTFYHVSLNLEERSSLWDLVESGKGSKERRKRAHILLLADINRDGGGMRDAEVANVLSVGPATVERAAIRPFLHWTRSLFGHSRHPDEPDIQAFRFPPATESTLPRRRDDQGRLHSCD